MREDIVKNENFYQGPVLLPKTIAYQYYFQISDILHARTHFCKDYHLEINQKLKSTCKIKKKYDGDADVRKCPFVKSFYDCIPNILVTFILILYINGTFCCEPNYNFSQAEE